ncbi:TIGR03620 family F420-dependent LLM class oxidoreductase [Pseudonocardia xinjiangensis]|uniref:TIGR03620 family F420-dependent LLM class oxidoreductase n=1 Tax=Pseudonocardia xinjiangensis TaxID=75289 RepID=UPI003D8E7AAA
MATEEQLEAAARWGRVGVGLAAPGTSADVWRRELARLEDLAYGSAWINEGIGRGETFSQLGLLLAATRRLVMGTGIANIWARQAPVMQAGAETLAAAFPGRLALGLGVSARVLVEASGLSYGRPLEEMAGYLDRMDASRGLAITPAVPFPRLLAALGPKMLELARDRADGAYPHSMPFENTVLARTALGPDKLLVVGVAVFLDDDVDRARSLAAQSSLFKIPSSPYLANLRRLGYTDDDFAPEPSARVIDAMFACGRAEAIAARVGEHLKAGADHVVLQPMGADLTTLVDQLEAISGHLPA